MDTYIDIACHVVISLLTGWGLWNFFRGAKRDLNLSLLVAFLFGVMVDLDHLFDYYLAFGTRFNYQDFISGQSFLVSGKNYIFFHGYEYVLILGVIAYFFKDKRNKMFLWIATLSLLFHLLTDIALFSIPFREYSLIYRYLTDFSSSF